ncbi:hypothetical protein EMPS_07399 [Entomortierella parvispora]|uniref:DUF2461 domain-containing protein n=1 Tax=Entomortierella parvispora TaxID=205924 RepID=A0A9P3LY44_9FUNG|nr:hypothetical protein EMPS_07399 [Entomortierella parvispora]
MPATSTTKQRPTRAAATKASVKKEPAPLVTTTNKRKVSAVAAPKAAPPKGTQKATPARSVKKNGKNKEDSAESEDEDEDDPEDTDFKEDEDEDDDDDEEPEDSEDDAFQDSSYSQSRKRTAASAPSRSTPASKKQAVSNTRLSKAATSKSATSSSTAKPQKTAKAGTILPEPTKTFLVSPLKIPHPKGAPFPDAIQPETLEFIRDLKLNNDREYMMLNQERCNAAKSDFMDFIRMLKEGLMEADGNIMDQEPKDSMMRIYRDIRFSNDKSPYKKQFACFFSRGGKKSIAAGYYFAISSGGESFAGCGVWDPSGPALQRIRQGLVDHSERFEEILSTDAIKKITNGKTGVDALRPGSSQLKTGPAGFPKDHPMIEYLKRKCFALGRSFTDEQVVSEGFLEELLQMFDGCVDLVQILNSWIG